MHVLQLRQISHYQASSSAPRQLCVRVQAAGKSKGKGFGGPKTKQRSNVTDAPPALEQTESSSSDNALQAPTSATPAAKPAAKRIPPASRDAVLQSCAFVSFGIAVVGLGLHAGGAKFLADPPALLDWPTGLSSTDVGAALAVAGAVTATRALLLGAWDDFREATDRSMGQTMPNLNPVDVVFVSVVPGVTEEMLFRGGLVPLFPNAWLGVVVSGVVFGLLHNNGGRNLAYSAWASAVGVLYGAAFVWTGNLYVPMLAHSVANVASAGLWLSKQNAAKA